MMYKNNFVVVIKCNNKILRERDGDTVYLPYGSEYSILIKNKDVRGALVDIEVDGENVLNGHKLIVGGNITQEIKGFMKNMNLTNKFKFIHKTKEIQDYRGDRVDDGLIRVSYQFEKQYQHNIFWPVYTCENKWRNFSNDVYFNDCSNTLPPNFYCNNNSVKCLNSVTPSADEGITVKGEKINQNYSYGNIDVMGEAIYTIILQLKGVTSNKKIVKKSITVKSKLQCEICGRKNKSSNKFCYNCGTYLE